ncbi:hypothetical protein GN244_ATG11844 [Phytophthora infestans]|uniref:Uncharacterized protein n=1 Tax=Phytophthora infestans TaxID=4787 RepID=A0A833SMT6_PHYIN|nr:hypothetical protein GN244_ATG11844 [Phytophthora infestans]KAF4137595.1 hypothetical protein GN958_ATG13221 [Phytophthora infestans]
MRVQQEEGNAKENLKMPKGSMDKSTHGQLRDTYHDSDALQKSLLKPPRLSLNRDTLQGKSPNPVKMSKDHLQFQHSWNLIP